MELAHKKLMYGVMAISVFMSTCFMTATILSIGDDTQDLLFDRRFSFLEGYPVNGFIPVIAGMYVSIGYFFPLWAQNFLMRAKIPSLRRFMINLTPSNAYFDLFGSD
jgi:hypothetical protein